MLDVYARFAEETLAIPVIRREVRGRAVSGRGRHVLHRGDDAGRQSAAGRTSHDLGQNSRRRTASSSRAAILTNQFAWSTSWGVSTRLVGALIMTHADDLAWSCRRRSRRCRS